MCQLLSPRSYQLIPGDAPNPLSFPKGFSIAVGLHLQQPSPLLSRNAVMLTNLFSSHCFFLGADLLLGFPCGLPQPRLSQALGAHAFGVALPNSSKLQ